MLSRVTEIRRIITVRINPGEDVLLGLRQAVKEQRDPAADRGALQAGTAQRKARRLEAAVALEHDHAGHAAERVSEGSDGAAGPRIAGEECRSARCAGVGPEQRFLDDPGREHDRFVRPGGKPAGGSHGARRKKKCARDGW